MNAGLGVQRYVSRLANEGINASDEVGSESFHIVNQFA
jgi:hypothetical protein